MGAGGQMSVAPVSKNSDVFRRSPYSKPPFTLGEIKKAIPPHCFRRSILRSFSYVVYDLTAIYVLYYVATNYFHLLPHPLPYLAWPLYWLLVGCIITGIWVIAHECGHHAFSDYQWLDNTVGFMLHSALLIPFFSWKYSHRSHHSNIASLERDEVFIPKTKSKINPLFKYFNNPLGRVLLLTIQFTLGLPLYLAFNATGRHYDGFANHFYPYSPIYTDRERIQVYLSDAGVLAVGYGLYRLVAAKGLAWFLCAYAGPWIVGHGIVVTITYLQHTHPSLPRYDSSEWDWLRGSLSTVDRDYGILNHVFHHINDTHVVHHLFSTMPHYHATEATKVIKPLLGDYYQADATPIIMAMWREAKECIYVEKDENDPSKGVFWFKKKL